MKKILALVVACVVGISTVGCGNSNLVAKVNGEGITVSEFEQQLKFTKFMSTLNYGDGIWEMMKSQNPDYQNMIKNQVLDQLIKVEELEEYAKKNNVKPDEKTLKAIKEENKKKFSEKAIKEKFSKTGLDEKFMDEYAEKIALMDSLSKYLLKKAEPTEKQMKEFYEKNNKKVDASHILISTVDLNTRKPLDAKQKEAAKKLAEKVYEEAKSGKDFAELAKKYSQDPGSKDKGGELGVFGKGAMVPEFEKEVFSMKVGEISKPVETQFGYHIIKNNKIVTEKFSAMKQQIRQELIQKNMKDLVEKIEKDSKVEKFENKLKEVPFGPVGSTESKDKKSEKKDADKSSNKESEKKTEK